MFYADQKDRGLYKVFQNLFFLVAFDAGHRIEMDQP